MEHANKILILENDKGLPDELSHYIDDTGREANVVTEIQNRPRQDLFFKVKGSKDIAIQSTFTDKEQFKSMVDLMKTFTGKTYHIICTSDRLHYTLHQHKDNAHEDLKELFEGNTIKEIIYERRIDPDKSGYFFKSYKYYFQEIELYYNKKHDAFFPERPICHYNNELKPVYKYKPRWEMRDWVFEEGY